jgi:hypothetical protein
MATIQGIYIALFGRPADPAGLAFFNQATNNGQNLNAIGDLSASDEYQDRFEGLNNVQIVTKIYQDLFGRDPDAAGLAFFVAQLNSGAQNINTIAINILDGAQGNDLLVVNNKIAAANLFTAEIDTAVEVGSYVGDDAADLGRAYLSTVTADAATIPTEAEAEAAVQGVVDFGVQGEIFELASGSDVNATTNTDPAAGDDDLTTNDNDIITVTGAYAATTDINAGLGTDRVNINLPAGLTTTTATSFVGVERLYVDSAAAATLNLAATDGLQQVWADNSAGLTVTGIETDVTIGVNGANGAVTVTFDDVAGSDDSANVVLSAASGTVDIQNVETLNINVTSASDIFLNADAEQVNITGSGDLALDIGTLPEGAVFDASDLNGKLDVDFASENDTSVIGGDFNDTFLISAGIEGVTVTGGAGSDLFSVGTLSNLDGEDTDGVPGISDAELDASIEADLISITDFNGSADTLEVNVAGAGTTFTNVQESNIAAAASLAAALDVVSSAAGASNYAIFEYDGDTYVYQNDATLGFSSGDGLVQLVGFTGELNDGNFSAI